MKFKNYLIFFNFLIVSLCLTSFSSLCYLSLLLNIILICVYLVNKKYHFVLILLILNSSYSQEVSLARLPLIGGYFNILIIFLVSFFIIYNEKIKIYSEDFFYFYFHYIKRFFIS